jgi:hypothetical protein
MPISRQEFERRAAEFDLRCNELHRRIDLYEAAFTDHLPSGRAGDGTRHAIIAARTSARVVKYFLPGR